MLLIVCEEYDVFICYAPPDKPFADEVRRKLEQWPYRLKVCIDYRDFLPGSGCNQLELSAKAIEQKCRKVLVIMSENLTNYDVTDFQAKVAFSLSPGLCFTSFINSVRTGQPDQLVSKLMYGISFDPPQGSISVSDEHQYE